MASARRTRTVAAVPQAVWDLLADFGSLSSWARNVDHSCLLEHRADGVGVGTSRRVQVGRNTLVERITEFTPGTTIGYSIEGLPSRLHRVTNCWTLEPTAQGLTTVTLTTTVEVGTNPVARVAERAMCRLLTKQSNVMLAGLAQRAEGRG
ncbi:MAG: SRPBCC family protein [Mycobacterium sp.]